MQNNKILDIFYGGNASLYSSIQKDVEGSYSHRLIFNPPHYLENEEGFDKLSIIEIGGEKIAVAEYAGFQLLVTKNSVVEMRITDNDKSFIQRVFDPTLRTITSFSIDERLNEDGGKMVNVDISKYLVCRDGNVDTSTFAVDLQPQPDFWENINLRTFSSKELIDFCINNSTQTSSNDAVSSFTISSNNETITLTEDKYTHHASYDKFKLSDFVNPKLKQEYTQVKFDSKNGSLGEQIQWFETNYKNKVTDSNFTDIYDMFKTLSPHLRQKQQSQFLGDNLSELMDSSKIISNEHEIR